jgi:hypothetical protein
MISKPNRKLNKIRGDIVSTGRKDSGYMGNHSYTPKHRKGCGFLLLIFGLTISSSAAVALAFLMDVV